MVSTPTPASDYLRDLPRRLERQAPALRKICIVNSTRGRFATQIARGIVQTATPEYPVQLISYSALDLDALLRELHASQPEILVLAGRFEQEIQILRARQRWAASIQAVAAVAAGVHAFRDELGRTAEGVIGPSLWEVHASFPAGRFSGSASDMQALCRTTTVFTFYRGFRLDSASRRQVGHRILLIQWDQDHRVQLPA